MKTPINLISLLFLFIVFKSNAQLSIEDNTFSYLQDFNTLASTGSTAPWTDNSTLPNWYTTMTGTVSTTYNIGTGSSNAGARYSFGAVSDPDRAFGSVSSNTPGTLHFGLRLKNNNLSNLNVVSINISYTGEQWRNGGSGDAQLLTFAYQKSSSPITSLTAGSWLPHSALDFVSPVVGAPATSLDGNNPSNRTSLSSNLVLSLAPGEEIMLRWTDINDIGNDHGLSLDDLTVSTVVLPIKLISFDLIGYGKSVGVNWCTSAEINNSHFEIQRSSNGKNFETIAEIKTAGNSNTTSHYSYTDQHPNLGMNYYRLKQIDYDGNSEYFEIRAINIGKSNQTIRIFPSQSNDMINIEGVDEMSKVEIYNLQGVLINTQLVNTNIDISALHPGLYIVRIGNYTKWVTKI